MAIILYTKERQLLDFISQFIRRFGFAPTLQEMADALGVQAVATVHEHLHSLVDKGFVELTTGQRRGIKLIGKQARFEDTTGEAAPELPVLGYIAAGEPLEPHSDPNLYLSVAPSMVSSGKPSYVLQVKGNSMIEEGILDGDYVVVQHQEEAQNGDIVIAVLRSGLATLKQIFFEEGRIRLQPANTTMSPIFVPEVRIQGKVVGLIRRFRT